MRRSRFAVALAVIGALVVAGGASAASRWVISSINQIKPSVRAQLNRASGAQGQQIVAVDSSHLTLKPGQTSVELAGNNWRAKCPRGMVVVGTGFDGPFNQVGGFVKAYGTFVGGYFENASQVTIQNVHVQAICARVSRGSIAAASAAGSSEAQYQAELRNAEAQTR